VNQSADWALRPTTLRFSLGDLVLLKRTFTAFHRLGHFTSIPIDDFKSLNVTWPPEASALLYHSVPISGSLKRISFGTDSICYVRAQFDRSYVDLSGSFEQYLKKFSGKSRSTLSRKVRKFNEAPGAEFRSYSSGPELLEFLRLAYPLSKRTYQERLLDAGLPDTEEFRASIVRMGDAGYAVGALLLLEGRPVAYLLCPSQAGTLLYEYVGYDPEYRELSPGTVLQYYLLERLFMEKKFQIFDFTEGEGQHKALFATNNTKCADVYIFRRSLANSIIVYSHAALDSASNLLGRILAKLHLKTAIKRLLRR
jgi:CelD/BcsL family acetyltransferase involved in cellulose biosynthesis